MATPNFYINTPLFRFIPPFLKKFVTSPIDYLMREGKGESNFVDDHNVGFAYYMSHSVADSGILEIANFHHN